MVITIIVLLILAGVSIATLTGNNGILTRAESANTENTIGKEKEEIGLAYNGAKISKSGGDIEAGDLNGEFIKNGTKAEATATGTGSITVTFSETGNIYTIDENGQISDPTNTGGTGGGGTSLKPGDKATSTVKDNYNDGTTTSQTNTATIPEGFTVSKESGETIIDSGLVVIAPDGSEFVWVPVPTVISDTEANATNNKAMAIADGKNYRGLLYRFSGTTSTVRSGCTTTTSDFREPDVVTGSEETDYDNKTKYLDIIKGILGTKLEGSDDLKKQLQTDYNAMIESVKTYGGFYIGKYETSLNEDTVQSKKNKPSATAEASSANMWYGLYAKQKTYSTESVQGSMIWGSQYDAMLNWALKGTDKSKVTATTNGNHTASVANTGTTATDKINNIYDLEGNLYEWTLEAYSTSNRVYRGGSYDYAYSPSSRGYRNPDNLGTINGSRLTLYIK